MRNKLRLFVCAMLACFGLLASTSYAFTINQDICKTDPQAAQSTYCKQKQGDNTLYGPDGILTKVVNIISLVAGLVAVVSIIIGGLMYVLASGDSAQVNKAKNAILYAVIGIAVTVLSQAVVKFVLVRIK